jgi:hypothetical protein
VAFLDHLTETLTRARPALTPVGDGEFTDTPTTLTFLGLIQQQGATEMLIAGRETALSEYRLYFPPGTDIVSSDTLTDSQGNVYDLGTPNDVQKRGRVGQCDMALKRDKVL